MQALGQHKDKLSGDNYQTWFGASGNALPRQLQVQIRTSTRRDQRTRTLHSAFVDRRLLGELSLAKMLMSVARPSNVFLPVSRAGRMACRLPL